MGTLEGKIECFSGTIQWIQIEGKYVPDVYHTVLHILILMALALTIIYTAKNRKKEVNSKLWGKYLLALRTRSIPRFQLGQF